MALKYGFCKKSVPATANPPKSDDKYAQKSVQVVRVSSFPSDFLQNPYFSRGLDFIALYFPNLKIGLLFNEPL